MEPGFFLDLADNTGNNFYYVILPETNYYDISCNRHPVTLVHSIVKSCKIDPTDEHLL